jgi:hypothetical protein
MRRESEPLPPSSTHRPWPWQPSPWPQPSTVNDRAFARRSACCTAHDRPDRLSGETELPVRMVHVMMMLARARAATTVSAHAAAVVATTRWSSRLARGVLGALDYSDVQVRAHAPGQHAYTSFRVCLLPSGQSWTHDNAIHALCSRCPCSLRQAAPHTHAALPPRRFHAGALRWSARGEAENHWPLWPDQLWQDPQCYQGMHVCERVLHFICWYYMQAHLWLSIDLTCVLDKTTRATATPPSVQQWYFLAWFGVRWHACIGLLWPISNRHPLTAQQCVGAKCWQHCVAIARPTHHPSQRDRAGSSHSLRCHPFRSLLRRFQRRCRQPKQGRTVVHCGCLHTRCSRR